MVKIIVDDHINDIFETNALEDIRKLYPIPPIKPLECLLVRWIEEREL